MDSEQITDFIHAFGNFSDAVIDTKLAKACLDFDPNTQDARIFLLNLRDIIVNSAGAADFIVATISLMLDENYSEESKQEEDSRREKLSNSKLGIPDIFNTTP